ncbi:hypothetical protein [Streptomyces xanthophaeus]|uniref:Uncharacterized protein n=1 Tax=Streptomyces xanthophaeus TaxID=67385 RepID=A0A919LI78_9ACTN|nr:hypothetical protein [Streptomyces xanthophaeus]GHI85189.1 hypothetical protein Sxan_25530 [Streptomyces xanthophaeus]
MPLLDADGDDIPATGLVAALRGAVRSASGEPPPSGTASRDGYGIPVVPVGTLRAVRDAQPPAYGLTDALYAAALDIAPVVEGGEPELLLLGFLLLDEDRARFYVTADALPARDDRARRGAARSARLRDGRPDRSGRSPAGAHRG